MLVAGELPTLRAQHPLPLHHPVLSKHSQPVRGGQASRRRAPDSSCSAAPAASPPGLETNIPIQSEEAMPVAGEFPTLRSQPPLPLHHPASRRAFPSCPRRPCQSPENSRPFGRGENAGDPIPSPFTSWRELDQRPTVHVLSRSLHFSCTSLS